MQVLPFVAFAKGDITYTRLRSYYSDAGMLDVEKVVLSDRATAIHFTATGKINAWFSFAPTTYLSDEKGARYSVKGAEGLELGKKCYIPKAGKTGFCLFFEPMPKETRIFDLIEGGEPGMFHIYGLHDAEAKVKIPVAEEATDAEETAESMFRPGKAVVRGRIEGYSRDWEDGILFFNLAETGDEASFTGRPCTLLQPDGTFCTELSLDCPVWTEMTLGNNQSGIPFYVRPGDTLDITASGIRENDPTAEYASSHPKGGYEKLMECRDVPVIYYGWERLTDGGRDLDEESFLKRADECVEENMRFCDYVAWKHGLSPWETRLLKNRQRVKLTMNHLLLASRLFQEKVEAPQKEVPQQDDFTGYDYSAYEVLDVIPLDDPSLSFLPAFSGIPLSLGQTWPMNMAWRYAFHNPANRTNDGAVDWLKAEMEQDSLQVETLRELAGVEGTPWVFQAFLADKASRLQGNPGLEESERVVDFLDSYLSHPYFKRKIRELHRLSGRSASWVHEMPEGKGRKEMKHILEEYKGKYVQVVWLSSPEDDFRFYGNPSVKNLAQDYESHPDLQLVAIVNRHAYSDKEGVERMIGELDFPEVHEADGESFLEMQELFRFSGSRKQMTFDRNGLVFKQPLDMKDETLFRQRLRRILKAEEEFNH